MARGIDRPVGEIMARRQLNDKRLFIATFRANFDFDDFKRCATRQKLNSSLRRSSTSTSSFAIEKDELS
jgi:hypothetical protein